MKNKLSENLKKIRKENNLSQEQLAEKMGVSRQAISKWESDQAYPEMEKIIQLCNMFNLNIDDLINSDISETKGEQDSKNNINKYIDDFLCFIGDTVNMFCSMTFKSKIKCLFEQCVIAFVLYIFFVLGGVLFNYSLRGIFLPYKLISVFESFYIMAAFVISMVVIIHIFKIRYLNYYKDNAEREESGAKCESDAQQPEKRFELNEKERIIIRDKKDGKYSFLNGMLRVVIGAVKICMIFAAVFLCFTLVCCTAAIIALFAIIKTGFVFAGALVMALSAACGNTVVLLAILNFVFNRKSNKKWMILTFVGAVAVFGMGLGTSALGLTQFETVDYKTDPTYVKESKVVEMNDDLAVRIWYEPVAFEEEDRDDVKIEYYKNKNLDIDLEYNNAELYYVSNATDYDIFKETLRQFNNKKIDTLGESITDVRVYASKKNIEKLKDNNFRMEY